MVRQPNSSWKKKKNHSRVHKFHKFSSNPNYMDPVYLVLENMSHADARINFSINFSSSDIFRIFGLTRLKFNFFDIFHLILSFQHLLLFFTSTSTCYQAYRTKRRRQFLPLHLFSFISN